MRTESSLAFSDILRAQRGFDGQTSGEMREPYNNKKFDTSKVE